MRRPSVIDHRPSPIGHRPSTIAHRSSTLGHRPSAIAHRSSTIGHRPSVIGHRPSVIDTRAAPAYSARSAIIGSTKEHYDLSAILQRDWKTLGPKLQGKLHLFIGEMDSYYLEEAAFLLKAFLDKADPPADATWDIGERAPHCYSGKPEFPGQRAEPRILPQMIERMLKTAPPGADPKSWRY